MKKIRVRKNTPDENTQDTARTARAQRTNKFNFISKDDRGILKPEEIGTGEELASDKSHMITEALAHVLLLCH